VQLLGSGDTPTNVGGTYTKFDMHSIQTTGNEKNASYFFMVAFGETGAAALAAGTYTAKVLTFDGLNVESHFEIMANRANAGSKVWARCKCPGQNTATLSFFFGLHEYVG